MLLFYFVLPYRLYLYTPLGMPTVQEMYKYRSSADRIRTCEWQAENLLTQTSCRRHRILFEQFYNSFTQVAYAIPYRFWQDLNKLGRIFYATTRICKKLFSSFLTLHIYYTPNFLIQLSAKFLVYKVFWSNLHNFYYIQTNKNARCGEATLGARYAHTHLARSRLLLKTDQNYVFLLITITARYKSLNLQGLPWQSFGSRVSA